MGDLEVVELPYLYYLFFLLPKQFLHELCLLLVSLK